MRIQPKYHWQLKEGDGSTVVDSVSGIEGTLQGTTWIEGPTDPVIELHGEDGDSYLEIGDGIGQFGVGDFTIAFWMQIVGNYANDDLNIIGTRRIGGHGQWFSLRLLNNSKLDFEVDQNADGLHYARAISNNLSISEVGHWHHIAIVRAGNKLEVYFDGDLVASGESSTGIANVDNGVDLRLGEVNRKTPNARYRDLRIYHTALDPLQIQVLGGMKYHWKFGEREGDVLTDSINGAEGNIHSVDMVGYGRIGSAIKVNGTGGRVHLGNEVGQFGTSDFTIAFGINILNTKGENDAYIIGNRNVHGHGNWFSLRLLNKFSLRFEVDENSQGQNHNLVDANNVMHGDQKWQHIAMVREGKTVRLYVDGDFVAESESETGVANINNDAEVRLGQFARNTVTARYEDLRVYHTALNDAQIKSLVPPVNRVLRPGQIELIATDDAAIILQNHVQDLTQYSSNFQKLRVGPDTAVTLYSHNNLFEVVAHKLYTDIPNIMDTKLNAAPPLCPYLVNCRGTL